MRRRSIFSIGLVLLVALAALSLGAGGAFAQTAVTLVSNTAKTTDNTAFTTHDHGQTFTTGTAPAGSVFRITSVKIDMHVHLSPANPIEPTYVVSLDTTAGVEVARFTNPTSIAQGVNTWTPTATLDLQPSTTYVLKFDVGDGADARGNRDIRIDFTSSHDEDAGAATGWSIGNARFTRVRGDATTFTATHATSTNPLKISVQGYVFNPPPPPPPTPRFKPKPPPPPPPDHLYDALQEYYDDELTRDELDTRLRELIADRDAHGPTPIPLDLRPDTVVQVGQQSGECDSGFAAPGISLAQIKDRQEWQCDTRTNQWVLVQRPPPSDPRPYGIFEQIAARENPDNICDKQLTVTIPSGPWAGETHTVRNRNYDYDACWTAKHGPDTPPYP